MLLILVLSEEIKGNEKWENARKYKTEIVLEETLSKLPNNGEYTIEMRKKISQYL